MARQVVLKPAARRDLENIHEWTWRNFGATQADTYARRIMSVVETAALNPLMAPNADHLREGLRRLVVESHIVYFRHDRTALTVVRILHGHMDPDRHL